MLKFRFFGKGKKDSESLNAVIKRMQMGDDALREKFIQDYIPFIIKNVSQFSGKYIEIENCDEFSVALSAFNEAINSFNEQMNCNFFKFSTQVIKRRLINYSAKNEKNQKVYPFTYFESQEHNEFEEKYLSIDSHQEFGSIEINDQMLLFENKLKEFNITLTDLLLHSPKHRDTKQASLRVAKILSQNETLFNKLMKKKTIPMADLLRNTDVSQKIIERNRKFIIAVTLIMNGQFDILTEFVNAAEKGEQSFE